MAKEHQLSVVFVYDSEACVSESDDPQEAVLYFQPAWVSEQQRLALCGQLMGATHFFLASFSCPKAIDLRSGQFAIRQCGRYILAVGADHCTLPWVLQRRADSLLGLLRLFHGGLEALALTCEGQRSLLVQRLQDVLDSFVPIAHNFGDLFGTETTLLLPKSASNVFLEAVQVLEFCQEQPGVLGGTILYNNRVVATQLSPDLTRRLIYSDPFRIKDCCAESVPCKLELPPGSRLLRVFLESREVNALSGAAAAARDAFLNVSQPRQDKPGSRQFGSTLMKRDVSRIFTVLEEREENFDDFDGPGAGTESSPLPLLDPLQSLVPQLDPQVQQLRKASAPLEERYTPPPFGRLSLPAGAVTPGTLGKVLHDRRLSICAQNEDSESDEDSPSPNEPEPSIFKHSPPPSTENKTLEEPSKPPTSILASSALAIKSSNTRPKSRSLEDIRPNVTNHGFCGPLPMRGYSFGLPKLNPEDFSPQEKSNTGGLQRLFNTITDPSYPVFRGDGLPVSQELFDSYLEQHYCELNEQGRAQKIKPKSPEQKVISPIITKRPEKPVSLLPVKPSEPKSLPSSGKVEKPSSLSLSKPQGETPAQNRQEIYRRSLSLPLKSIVVNGTSEEEEDEPLLLDGGRRRSFVPEHGRLQDIEMTPLSSILSFSERAGTPGDVPGFPRAAASTPGARVTTPAEFRSFMTASSKREESRDEGDLGPPETMTQCALFAYTHQNMALLLLLERQEHAPADWDLLETLGDSWIGAAPQLEARLRRCLEQSAAGSAEHRGTRDDIYSFLCLDPAWDALQRGGPWGAAQLGVARRLHSDMRDAHDMTEIIARCDEQIVYGYQCCRQQVFYQQAAGPKVGLPTPADLMGTVPLKAKRRLERDHGVVLL